MKLISNTNCTWYLRGTCKGKHHPSKKVLNFSTRVPKTKYKNSPAGGLGWWLVRRERACESHRVYKVTGHQFTIFKRGTIDVDQSKMGKHTLK